MENIEVAPRRCKVPRSMFFRRHFFYFGRAMAAHRRSSAKLRSSTHLASFDALLFDAGIQPERFFRILRKDLAGTADPLRAVNNLHRFLSSGFTASILRDFQRHPVLQKIALEIFSQSQYLADILVRDPQLFRWLTATPVLKSEKTRQTFSNEAKAAVGLFSRADRKLDALKRFHRREILRIGCRDVLREADVVTVTRELSGLADSIIESVLEIGWQDLKAKTGISFENTLSVIGLGKLGGEELNFSSDIDLLFLYEADGEFRGEYERIRTYHEFYNRLAEFIVRKLTEFTGEGSLYRVDMRLRPEGRSGPLALSVPAAVAYYEARGETWERQMLVKARLSAGNVRTASQWLTAIRPFVFPKTFLRNPLEELSDMKARIEARIDSEGNVKLGEGGIRDVEFITQGLQLLAGGTLEHLRERNTLRALEELGRARKLRKRDVTALSDAYKFLRSVEHRLQLLHGTQTHTLPEEESETALLARRLGFRSSRAFTRALRSTRRTVRIMFQSVLRPMTRRRSRITRSADKAPKFIERGSAERHVQTILGAFQGSEEDLRRRVNAAVGATGAPDWCAESLALLAESPPVRRVFVQAWNNKELVELLANVGAKSRATIGLMVREPILFETLAGLPEEWFSDGWGWKFLREHDLQRFHAYNEQKIIVRFLSGSLTLSDAMKRLSNLAEDLLLEAAGRTPGLLDGAVLALGKMGGGEITVRSDLDLVFVYDNQRQNPSDAERAVKDFASLCKAHGVHEIDFRLRPEGKNAPLAVDLQYYQDYLRERAVLWERQAFLKARVLFGAPGLKAALEDLRTEFLFERPLPEGWKSEIRVMKERVEAERSSGGSMGNLKTAVGGLMDLEFAVQALQLKHGRMIPDLRTHGTLETVQTCVRKGILGKREGEAAVRNLLFLRSLETFIKLNTERADFVLPEDPIRLQALACAVGQPTKSTLVRHLQRTIRSNRAFFDRILRD